MTAEPVGRVPDPTYEHSVLERARELANAIRLIKAEVDDLGTHRDRINGEYEALDAAWRTYTAEAYGETRQLAALLDDPVTHEPTVAYWRQDENRTYDVAKLREHVGDEVIASLFGKPKILASKFDAAVEAGTIPLDVAAAVVTITPKAGYIAFTAPEAPERAG